MRLRSRSISSIAFAALILTASTLPLILYVPVAKAMTLYDSGNPTTDEQEVLEYINRARANPIAEGQRLGIDIHEGLVNPSLVGPRPPLAMNSILLGIAEAHSSDMYNQNYFSHNDLNGNTPFDRMTKAGYDYARAGEDMAAGSGMSASDLEDFMMVDSGTQERPHRINLLDIFPYPCGSPPCAYSDVGIGYYAAATPNSISNAFITVDFGAQYNAGPFLLGVVYNDLNGNNFYDAGEGMAGITITPSTGSYYAISTSSGGYAIPIGTSGTITVTASGPGFGQIIKTVTLTGTNIKLDFTPQPSSTTGSQSVTQTVTQSTTQTFQSTEQTSTSFQSSQSVTEPMPQSITFQSTPASFGSSSSPATITACGNTFANTQSATYCGSGFMATANLPVPSNGWKFNHWAWGGGVSCSSDSANPTSCSAFDSGSLTAVYEAQVNVVTNPASSALISWGSCSNSELGNGASFFSTSFGTADVNPCYLPPGYTLSSWTCTGGLTCSGSNGPASVTFTGPGTITLNLQAQASTTTTQVVSTSSPTSSTISPPLIITLSSDINASSTITTTTLAAPEFQATQSMMLTSILGVLALAMIRRRASRKN
jgi:uncharacterized protein YkwD